MVEANNRDYSNPWYVKYKRHLKDARRRGIVSNLEYEDYVQKVNDAGITEPEQIGKHRGQFVLGRFTDEGPYTKASCRFIPSEENLKEAFANGRHDEWIASRQGMNKENSEWMRKISETLTGRSKETHAGPAAVSAALSGRTKETHEYLARQSARQLGQTKETSEMYRKGALARTGRTKETHAGLAAAAEKMRGRTKENHAGVAARAAAMRGRTAETHEHIARTAEKLRGRSAETHAYIAESAKKRSALLKGRSAETHDYIARRAGSLATDFVLIAPDGEIHHGRNIKEFSRNHGLDSSGLSKACKGKLTHCSGWVGYYPDPSKNFDRDKPIFIVSITEAYRSYGKKLENAGIDLNRILSEIWTCVEDESQFLTRLEALSTRYRTNNAALDEAIIEFTKSLRGTFKALKLYDANDCISKYCFLRRQGRYGILIGKLQ